MNMKDFAEIVRVIILGRVCYQVNVINARTGLYYNSSSQYFDKEENAIKFAKENELTIKNS